MNARMDEAEILRRKKRIRLVLTDCDGVLTDGTVFYGPQGESLKQFSLRDGMGVERLRQRGIDCAIITREHSAIVQRRAEKLKMPHLFLGIENKEEHLAHVLNVTKLSREQLAYIGDDVNDLAVMVRIGEVGLTAAPADALPEVANVAHFRCTKPGGHGAFREFAEWLMSESEDA